MPDGTEIRFTVNSGNVLREDWLTYTEQALKVIGIKVVAEPQEYSTLVTAVTRTRTTTPAVLTSPAHSKIRAFCTTSSRPGSSGNFTDTATPPLTR